MNTKNAIDKEKEKAAKLKALRRELETELEEQLEAAELKRESAESIAVHKVDTSQELPADRAKQVIEALLFASSKPLTIAELRRVVRGYTPKQVEKFIEELREEYTNATKSFEVLEIAGGYEIATKKEFAPWIMRIELQKKVRQATQSALETLAILAYKQPITRAEIEALRGVDVSGVLNTLVERGFIKIVGKKEVPGRPFMYGTSEKFLEHFGLNSLKDLPSIEEIQSVVSQSVRKEELIGKQQVIAVEEGGAEGEAAEAGEAPRNEEVPQVEETPDTAEESAPESETQPEEERKIGPEDTTQEN